MNHRLLLFFFVLGLLWNIARLVWLIYVLKHYPDKPEYLSVASWKQVLDLDDKGYEVRLARYGDRWNCEIRLDDAVLWQAWESESADAALYLATQKKHANTLMASYRSRP